MSGEVRRPVYQTGQNEKGKRFCNEKLWKGHRVVDETMVEFMREILRETEDSGERQRAKEWIDEYEEKSRV